MKLGSLFDGIGGWPLAATKFGIEPVWCSEIEKFPQEITKRHFPNMKHLGDITKIDGAKIEPVDIVTIGSPCQDLSIAGKRKGLAGERSGLFRTAIDIVRGMRNSTDGEYPRFVVWENVPGAFSSNKGMDFRAVLEEITESDIPMPKSGRWAHAGMVRSGKCEIAWRILDAQYWGVPQRRKRIFLVADFRGERAGEILFKPTGMSRNITASSGERKRVAGCSQEITNESVQCLTPWDVQSRRIFSSKGKWPSIYGGEGGGKGYVAIWDMTHANEVMRPVKDGITPTLNARMGTGGNQVPLIQEPVCLDIANPRNNPTYNIAPTLCARMGTGGDQVPVIHSYCIAGNIIGRENNNGGHQLGIDKDVCFTLNTVDRHAVCVPYGSDDCRNLREQNKSGTLQAKENGGYSLNYTNPVIIYNTVRRLTPTECERLQGLPDGYTAGGSDSARYKALGNGMAQPCADFVIGRIAEVAMEDVGSDDK